MNPTQQADSFASKYTQFHPQSTVWCQNPFDHDVIFQVADEYNTPYSYKIAAHSVAELPGGAVATLGVKAIVDELIQGNQADVLRMWDADVRGKHEKDIILRVKEASVRSNTPDPTGDIDLSVKPKDDDLTTPPPAESVEETAFPDLQQPNAAANEVQSIANASLGSLQANATIETD